MDLGRCPPEYRAGSNMTDDTKWTPRMIGSHFEAYAPQMRRIPVEFHEFTGAFYPDLHTLSNARTRPSNLQDRNLSDPVTRGL